MLQIPSTSYQWLLHTIRLASGQGKYFQPWTTGISHPLAILIKTRICDSNKVRFLPKAKKPFQQGCLWGAHSCIWRRRFYNRREWGQCVRKSREKHCWETQGRLCLWKPSSSPKPLALEPFPCINVDSPQKPSWHRASTTHLFLSGSKLLTYFPNSLTWLMIMQNPQRLQTGALRVVGRPQIISGSHWRMPDKIWNS